MGLFVFFVIGKILMYYHGTSTELLIEHKLLPPDITGKIQEVGRKKNTNKVFFTKDKNSAKIYAGRSVKKIWWRKNHL